MESTDFWTLTVVIIERAAGPAVRVELQRLEIRDVELRGVNGPGDARAKERSDDLARGGDRQVEPALRVVGRTAIL